MQPAVRRQRHLIWAALFFIGLAASIFLFLVLEETALAHSSTPEGRLRHVVFHKTVVAGLLAGLIAAVVGGIGWLVGGRSTANT